MSYDPSIHREAAKRVRKEIRFASASWTDDQRDAWTAGAHYGAAAMAMQIKELEAMDWESLPEKHRLVGDSQ